MLRHALRCCLCLFCCVLLHSAALATPAESDAAAVLVVDASLEPSALASLAKFLTGEGGLLDAFAAGGGARRAVALVVFDRDAGALSPLPGGPWSDVGGDPAALSEVKAALDDITPGTGANLEGGLAIAGNLLTHSSLSAPVDQIQNRLVLLFSPVVPTRFPSAPVPGDATRVAGAGESDGADYRSCQNIPDLARAIQTGGDAQLLVVGYGDLDQTQVVTATVPLSCSDQGWHLHALEEGYGAGTRGRPTEDGFSLHYGEGGMIATGHRENKCGNGCFPDYFQGAHQVLSYDHPTVAQWLRDTVGPDALYAPDQADALPDHFPPPAPQSAQLLLRHVYHTFLTDVDEEGQVQTDRESSFTEEDPAQSVTPGTSVPVRPRPPQTDPTPDYGPFHCGLAPGGPAPGDAPNQSLDPIPGDNVLTLEYSRRVDLREESAVRVVHRYTILDANPDPGQNQSRTWEEEDAPLTGWFAGQRYHPPYRLADGFTPDQVEDPDPHETGVRLSPGEVVIVLSYLRRTDTTPAPPPVVPQPPAASTPPRREEAETRPPAIQPPALGPTPTRADPPLLSTLLEQVLRPETWEETLTALLRLPLLRLLPALLVPRT